IAAILDRARGNPRPIETAGGPRAPGARVRWSVQGDRLRAGRGGAMRDRRIPAGIDPCGADQRPERRPFALPVEPRHIASIPDLVEIAAIPDSAADNDRKATLAKRCRELAPARGRPALVSVHRGGMDDRIRLGGNKVATHITGWAD